MPITVGFGELMAGLSAIVAVGWGILRMSFAQFEKRIDSKFNSIERLELEVKRIEVETIRTSGQNAILYATKEDLTRAQEKHDKTLERVFGLLQSINDKLDRKVDREECEKMMRKTDR